MKISHIYRNMVLALHAIKKLYKIVYGPISFDNGMSVKGIKSWKFIFEKNYLGF
jgi:hypothetical protein